MVQETSRTNKQKMENELDQARVRAAVKGCLVAIHVKKQIYSTSLRKLHLQLITQSSFLGTPDSSWTRKILRFSSRGALRNLLICLTVVLICSVLVFNVYMPTVFAQIYGNSLTL